MYIHVCILFNQWFQTSTCKIYIEYFKSQYAWFVHPEYSDILMVTSVKRVISYVKFNLYECKLGIYSQFM